MSVTELVNDGADGVDVACKFTGLGRTTLYALMDSGRLPWVKVGGRRLIPRAALRQLLADGLVGATAEQSNG